MAQTILHNRKNRIILIGSKQDIRIALWRSTDISADLWPSLRKKSSCDSVAAVFGKCKSTILQIRLST